MSTHKTEKELAYLHELYVSPDWGERFAQLVDEFVKLPARGRALYVASGTGGHALALRQRAGKEFTMICVDESEERLELARAKAAAVKEVNTEFLHGQIDALGFDDEQFDLVVGDASLIAPERLPEMLAEMARVAAPGATVSLSVATASSFGEFFSVFWEALTTTGYDDQAAGVATLIGELPTAADMERLFGREALEEVESHTRREEFDYASGDRFLRAPLVENFLLGRWLESLPDDEARAEVLGETARIIDDERQDADFVLSIKATVVVGRKVD